MRMRSLEVVVETMANDITQIGDVRLNDFNCEKVLLIRFVLSCFFFIQQNVNNNKLC